MISIIIPTYNELENVKIVAEMVRKALTEHIEYEIIFVDDSTDNTPIVLEELARQDGNVRFHHRTNEKGLGTAVIKGFELVRGDVLVVMDADLQHPPTMIMPMVNAIKNGADIVIPSRFVPGGDDGGLRLHRKIVSAVARYLGKLALTRVRHINDPTSGFFAFRKNVIHDVNLKPIGWKILIEVLVRGTYCHVSEIPYRFQPRNAGESKMTLKEQLNYIKHLIRLIKDSPEDRRFFLFIIVGISGLFVNTLCYTVMVQLGTSVVLSGILSALLALISNFLLNDHLTWSDSRHGEWGVRAAKYVFVSTVGIGINVGILSELYSHHTNYLLANLAGIIVATLWNYTLSNLWTWRNKNKYVIKIRRPGIE